MSNILINETPIEVELSNTIIQPIVNETKIEMELGQVISAGGSFMLDDLTNVTIIEAAGPLPTITQTKELLIQKLA